MCEMIIIGKKIESDFHTKVDAYSYINEEH